MFEDPKFWDRLGLLINKGAKALNTAAAEKEAATTLHQVYIGVCASATIICYSIAAALAEGNKDAKQ
jgi:hypothetical protein